jgi:NADH-quinone oxidoreductase subunit L
VPAEIKQIMLVVVFAPLIGCLIAGLLGKKIGKAGAHTVTILAMLVAFAGALWLTKVFVLDGTSAVNFNLYTWAKVDLLPFQVGFLLDNLSVLMLLTVTFVSLLVHIYSIGYMHGDPGYQRFFSYISLFTFAMLMLVAANNFLQLFFGWEGVGLASYLLIGFWYKKESALQGSLKAFLVNRVGDFGFLLGIAAVLTYTHSLDYQQVFQALPALADQQISLWQGSAFSVITVTCILLFIGAMGKSAQIPLHVWLPESMEGPTPISALIHAATMVTAGIYMVTRLSPMYELSDQALNFILIIGATGALFMGLLGLVQNDIKRVVAYSTLSQLGYMIASLGASAYSAGMFHLFTHACFKALLFLGAGSVIIAMHHEQDMRKMGGLWLRMPITYVTFLLGTLALCGFPPFAGFYSKDSIIEAIHASQQAAAHYAYWCVLLGVFVTALYSCRCLFLVFHGKPRMDEETLSHVHESPWVVWLPLVLLAIPSVVLGWMAIEPMLYAKTQWLAGAVSVLEEHDVLASLADEFAGPQAMIAHALHQLPLYFALAGAVLAWLAYLVFLQLPALTAHIFKPIYLLLRCHYGFDVINDWLFVRGARGVGCLLSSLGERAVIDDGVVNGSGRLVQACARGLRKLQTGLVYHYALVMVLGLLAFLSWLIFTANVA